MTDAGAFAVRVASLRGTGTVANDDARREGDGRGPGNWGSKIRTWTN